MKDASFGVIMKLAILNPELDAVPRQEGEIFGRCGHIGGYSGHGDLHTCLEGDPEQELLFDHPADCFQEHSDVP